MKAIKSLLAVIVIGSAFYGFSTSEAKANIHISFNAGHGAHYGYINRGHCAPRYTHYRGYRPVRYVRALPYRSRAVYARHGYCYTPRRVVYRGCR